MKLRVVPILLMLYTCGVCAATGSNDYVFAAGHPSLKVWLMPAEVPYPKDNKPTEERIELGKKLFFDPRLSGDGNMSCASCHSPMFGWSDGLPTAKGFQSKVLGRATPTIINAAYNGLQMWDGRKTSLEDQAMGPMKSEDEMNMDIAALMTFLKETPEYRQAFAKAYPGEPINETTLAKAIASFERTVISRDTAFDKWVKGNKKAMNDSQVNGFKLFVNPGKGNCAVCHTAPNFTDDGFHNVGLASFGASDPDLGRYKQKPIGVLKGAFKTPTLRGITHTAPYFHDGSAKTLADVVEHYGKGGAVKTNLSPNMKELDLSEKEKRDLIAFLQALAAPQKPFTMPVLPL